MILDYLEKLSTDDESANATLARLSQGLFWLYDSVNDAEKHVRKNAAKDNVLIGVVDGVLKNVPSDIPVEWLSCAFQWYAVSVYNYARLVGWLAFKDVKQAKEYANNTLPRISVYRNKVAAHFAITDPWKDDNLADQSASIMTNTIYAHGYLRAGAMSEVLVDENGSKVESSHKTSWSLTKAHNQLIPRYWPNGPIKVVEAIKMPAKSTKNFKIDFSD